MGKQLLDSAVEPQNDFLKNNLKFYVNPVIESQGQNDHILIFFVH
jgi:hypothetical protein